MKGILVKQRCTEPGFAAVRGEFFWIKRIVILELENLVITPEQFGHNFFAWLDFDLAEAEAEKFHSEFDEEAVPFKCLGEVEVPDEIAQRIYRYAMLGREIEKFKTVLAECIGKE